MAAGTLDAKTSVELLEVSFSREVEADRRIAAETAYALAFRYRNEDIEGRRQFDKAKVWALRAIDLLDSLPSDTLSQVASSRTIVSSIPIPDYLHSGVVRERLADVLI